MKQYKIQNWSQKILNLVYLQVGTFQCKTKSIRIKVFLCFVLPSITSTSEVTKENLVKAKPAVWLVIQTTCIFAPQNKTKLNKKPTWIFYDLRFLQRRNRFSFKDRLQRYRGNDLFNPKTLAKLSSDCFAQVKKIFFVFIRK